jgi:G3E family GTPase
VTVRYQEPEFLPWDGRRVPITFVGGYLGAGKTTTINNVLANADRPIAVIVNDVGSINIDAALIRKRDRDLIEVTNGCVCCSSLDGMGAAFDQIRARPQPPDHVLVELSGVAEPQRMLPWGNSAGFMLDGVVVVVAADQLANDATPDWIRDAVALQITTADLLILTKTDLTDDRTSQQARLRLSELAPQTPIFDASRDLAHTGAVGRFLSLGGRRPSGPSDTPAPTLFDVHSVSMRQVPLGLTRAALHEWLAQLPFTTTGQLVRAKGIVDTTDAGQVLIQIVGKRTAVTPVPHTERQPSTDLVVITLNLPS